MMNETVLDLMKLRKSAREFEPYVATAAEVSAIVEGARRAPSSKNTQPWKLLLLQGETLAKLRESLCKKFDAGEAPAPELEASVLPQYRRRAVELGKSLFIYKGIAREDKEARRLHDRANFEFFNAPQVFALGVDREAYHSGTLVDCGIFLGYLLLAIEAAGFASCPQMSPLIYPQCFKEVLPEVDGTLFLCVVPFGKPLAGSHVNAFETTREEAEVWFRQLK